MSVERSSGAESPLRVLVVDDEPFMLQAWRKILAAHPCELRTLSEPADALEQIQAWAPEVTVLDVRMPRVSGLDLLQEIRRQDLPTEVVMMTAYATVETAVEAVKNGAYDFLTKPFSNIEAAALTVLKAAEHRRLIQRNRQLESRLEVRDSFEGLVGSSPRMKRVFELIEGVAYSASTVLVQGESGTGKELVARAIHHRSPRAARPFVAVNCSALTDTLLESELFGHEKGAFTGAIVAKRGLFEVADGGSIFLDEIGEVPPPTQVKLLRVLQEGEMKRVGSTETRKVQVRVIAATNADLARARKQGLFRDDLYYRLNVIAIDLPPLRERAGDISILAGHFLHKYALRNGKSLSTIHPQAMELLERYSWPGNVRELENVVERAVVLGRGSEIGVADLPPAVHSALPALHRGENALGALAYREAKTSAVNDFERRYTEDLLGLCDGNISEAARRAGMDRSNFRRMVKRHRLEGGVRE
jgi:two-component system, NtrC family, response regulator HydG